MSINGEKNELFHVEHLQEIPFVMQVGDRLRVQSVPVGESCAIQADAEHCDINNIIARYERTGFLPPATREGVYDDVSNLNRDLGELIQESVGAMRSYSDFLEAQKKATADAALTTDQPMGVTGVKTPEVKGPGQDAPLSAT